MSSTAEVGIRTGTEPAAQVTAGDRIVVAARTIGEETGTQAQAEAATKADDKSTGSRWVVGAGVAIGLYEHNADARVAERATLKAPQIGIHADVSLPRKPTPPEKLIKNWDSWEEVYGKVDTLKDLIDPGAYFNGATSAETDGTEVSLAGGFDLQRYTGNARTTVERRASLVLMPASVPAPTTAGAWSHSFVFGPEDTDTEEFKFAHRIQVQAQQASELWFLAGKLGKVSAGKVAAGGSYNQIIRKGDTLALLHEGVQVRGEDASGNAVAAGDVGVSAITTDRLVAVTVGAGKGESFGLTGSFSVTSVNRTTLAAIDDEAKVNARQVRVEALQDMSAWAIAGAVGRAQSAAVGLGAAVNDGTAEVTARIGDIDARASGGTPLTLTDGGVTTADLA